jgi:hypothetical protein
MFLPQPLVVFENRLSRFAIVLIVQ